MQTAVTYTLLAQDRWCDNLGGAVRIGDDFNGYSLVGCQAQCSKDRRCAFLSFNQNDGWCSKYAVCGEPTTTPNEFPQDPRGWLTFARDFAEACQYRLAEAAWCMNLQGNVTLQAATTRIFLYFRHDGALFKTWRSARRPEVGNVT
ncbi:unnamed protein product [Symbiodinium natans]|uniref:Apple domain-containing protein n=1 Tax=Symbiodinium natans TaxID=878477 RepID=A0A812STG3_9DINO|nr:unnamed protein product [Symbiodinium natans]